MLSEGASVPLPPREYYYYYDAPEFRQWMLKNGFSAEDWQILKEWAICDGDGNGKFESIALREVVDLESEDEPFKLIAERLLSFGFEDEITIYFWW